MRVWGGSALRGAVGAAALALVLIGMGVGGVLARSAGASVKQVRSVNIKTKAVALTFDDGPNPTYTPQILELLGRYGFKATFFVIGQELLRYPEIAQSALAAGMELGNHGMHHLALVGLDPTAIQAEVAPVEREITALSGTRPVLYRLPRGRGDPSGLRTLADQGYTAVYWSVDPHDYLNRDPAKVAAQVEAEVRPGSIVIFHDGGGNRSKTVAAIALILPWLKAQGYQAVTVSQLLELSQQQA